METRPTTDQVKKPCSTSYSSTSPGARCWTCSAGDGTAGHRGPVPGSGGVHLCGPAEGGGPGAGENLKATGLAQQGKVVQGTPSPFLMSCREKFDVIFLDPPYAPGLLEKAVETVSRI